MIINKTSVPESIKKAGCIKFFSNTLRRAVEASIEPFGGRFSTNIVAGEERRIRTCDLRVPRPVFDGPSLGS
jgi:hypothetical protein